MRPLAALRRAAPYDRHFASRSPLLWPIERAARSIAPYDDFPDVEALAGVFEDAPPVRFVSAAPRRRRGTPVDARALYDGRITLDREVPTRARCWHDLMNALVWGTFPRSKLALHARQHRAIAERLEAGARRLPPVRTPELDALALLDEGGVIVPSPGAGAGRAAVERSVEHEIVVFGHAIYESLVLGVEPAIVAAVAVPLDGADARLLRAIDAALARMIADGQRLRAPGDLRRIQIEWGGRGRSCAAARVSVPPDGAGVR